MPNGARRARSRCSGLRLGRVMCAMCVNSCTERISGQLRESPMVLRGSGGVGQTMIDGDSRKGHAEPLETEYGSVTSTVTRLRGRLPTSLDRKSTRLNSSHVEISYAVFCLKKKKKNKTRT